MRVLATGERAAKINQFSISRRRLWKEDRFAVVFYLTVQQTVPNRFHDLFLAIASQMVMNFCETRKSDKKGETKKKKENATNVDA